MHIDVDCPGGQGSMVASLSAQILSLSSRRESYKAVRQRQAEKAAIGPLLPQVGRHTVCDHVWWRGEHNPFFGNMLPPRFVLHSATVSPMI